MSNQLSDQSIDGPGPAPVRIATYARYDEAQAAVDRLSDEGLPVSGVTIVWRGLRQVEHVTGRRTVATAAIEGLISGAWFGSLIGLLLALLVDTGDTSELGLIFTYLVVGAVAGAVWQAVSHALRRGRRDFSSQGRLDAETYELWVTPELVTDAQRLLGVGTIRAGDPR